METVCSHCIGEPFLSAQIAAYGDVGRCHCCEAEEGRTIELGDLAEQVKNVLDEHFYMTSSEPEGIDVWAAREGLWEQAGYPVSDVIMNLVDSSEELAEAVREYLSDKYDPYGKDSLCSPSPFASDSQYEERMINDYEFREDWKFLREEITTRARFFSTEARSILDHLFSGVERLTTNDGESVVRVFGDRDCIYRARVAKKWDEVEHILKEAPGSLGAPPRSFAGAGRMNAEGISVFYGATDIETCTAEIRSPVGGLVVVGEFMPTRELRLLDLTLLHDVYLDGSLFDPAHTESQSRLAFLRRLVSEVSLPVLPGAEALEYLPTQVVAEYLGAHPDMQLDGVIFNSSQVSLPPDNDSNVDQGSAGKNVVIFAHACGLEAYQLPEGAKVDVSMQWGDPDDPFFDITVWERMPNTPEPEASINLPVNAFSPIALAEPPVSQQAIESLNAGLRLNMESIQVLEVKGVSYFTSSVPVSRYRVESNDVEF